MYAEWIQSTKAELKHLRAQYKGRRIHLFQNLVTNVSTQLVMVERGIEAEKYKAKVDAQMSTLRGMVRRG